MVILSVHVARGLCGARGVHGVHDARHLPPPPPLDQAFVVVNLMYHCNTPPDGVTYTALIDACVRLLPGVLGAPESLAEESFQSGLLEYPQYTRPAEWQGRAVPEVLLSGHHERIQHWRLAQAQKTTRERRVDLWSRYVAGLKEVRVSS